MAAQTLTHKADQTLAIGLPPILPRRVRVLILGSLPGAESLRRQQYYAHPANAFWFVMGHLCGFDAHAPYRQRVSALKRAGVAVWDVLAQAHRRGSADSAIDTHTERPNPIGPLLAHPTPIGFNGTKALTAFRRHILPTLTPQIQEGLTLLSLPSTSPAHATLSKEAKLHAWTLLKPYLRTSTDP